MTETPRTEPHSPTRARKDAFLEVFQKVGNVSETAKQTAIGRRTHYEWLDTDPEYASQFKDAEQDFADLIRETVRDRAILGISQEVFDTKGNVTGSRTVYSDRLLELLAKAKCPEFRDRHEITGPNGGPVKIEVLTGVPQPE